MTLQNPPYSKVLTPILVMLLAVMAGFLVTQPLSPTSPSAFILGAILLLVVIFRPQVGVMLLITTLMLSPIYPLLSDVFTLNRAIGVLTLLGIILRKVTGIDKSPPTFFTFDYLFWAFMLVVLFSLLINGYSQNTRILLLDVVMGYLFYWLIINTITTWAGLRVTLLIIVLANLVVAFRTINLALQALDEQTRYNVLGGATVNIYGNLFFLSIICLLMVAENTHHRLKIIYYMLIPVFFLALILTGNRSGMVALISAGALYMLIYGNPRQRINLIIAVGLLLLVGYLLATQLSSSALDRALDIPLSSQTQADQNTRIRLELYGISLNLFWHHPMVGIGLGNFGKNAGFYAGVKTAPHNVFLGTLAETGIMGISLMALMFLSVLYPIWQQKKTTPYTTHTPQILKRAEMLNHALIMVIGYNIMTNLTNGHTISRYMFVVFAIALIVIRLCSETLSPSERALSSSL